MIGRNLAVDRAPTVAFTVKGQSSAALAERLAQAKLGVGVGNFYAYRLVKALGIDVDDGVVRVSFVHYNSKAEVDRLIKTSTRCWHRLPAAGLTTAAGYPISGSRLRCRERHDIPTAAPISRRAIGET